MMCSQDESGEQRAMHWRHHGILDGPEQREQQVFGLVFQTAFAWRIFRVHAAHVSFGPLYLKSCHCSLFLEDNTNLVHCALLESKLLRLPEVTFQKD